MEQTLITNAVNFLNQGEIEKARDLLDQLLDQEESTDLKPEIA